LQRKRWVHIGCFFDCWDCFFVPSLYPGGIDCSAEWRRDVEDVLSRLWTEQRYQPRWLM
jgi:hypothetical protein